MTTTGKYLIRKDPDPDPRYCWYYTWTGPDEDQRDYGSHETWELALASVLRDMERCAAGVTINEEYVHGWPLRNGCARCSRTIEVGEPALIVERHTDYAGAVCYDCSPWPLF